ncbi:MAG: sulfocyanin-like copper-binding protein [Cypionkella sp.]
MKRSVRLTFAAAGLFLALPLNAAFADATIKVSLWDKGPDSMTMTDAQMGMKGMMDMKMASMGMMGITLDVATVKAGKVTFEVTNDSKDIIHEMIVSPIKAGETELPYITDENRVDEEKADHLGEVSELDPGKGGALTVDLKPGTYILYCNIPGHFIDGMWTELTVTP